MTRILTNLRVVRLALTPRDNKHRQRGNEQAPISSISQSCTTSIDANGNTTDQIARTDCDSSPEECISSIVTAAGENLFIIDEVEF